MEEDNFAFFVFSGFVAASTVVTWAIVSYISREQSYETAKRKVQTEDLSWMENESSQATPVKVPTKAKAKGSKGFNKQQKPKSQPVSGSDEKVNISENYAEETVELSQFEMLASSATKPQETKSPAPKKKKDKKTVATTVSVTETRKPESSSQKVEAVATLESADEEEWQAVPVKGGRPSGPKASQSKERRSQAEVPNKHELKKEPVGKTTPLTQVGPKIEVKVKGGSTEPLHVTTAKGASKSFDEGHRGHSSQMMIHGEGSPVSENLEHSDSTEELLESNHVTYQRPLETPKYVPSQKPVHRNGEKPVQKGVVKGGGVSPMVSASSVPAATSVQTTQRVKRMSERSTNSAASSEVKNKAAKREKEAGMGVGVGSVELQKLEDELKRERNHSQDLRKQFLMLNDQLDKEKRMTGSISEQLQQKIQECASLKSRLGQVQQAKTVPVAVPVEDDSLLVKRLEAELEALRREKSVVLQKELEQTKVSSVDLKRDVHVAKLQAAESQLKKIESRNNELQHQCNKYEMQLKSVTSAQNPHPQPHNVSSFHTHNSTSTATSPSARSLKEGNNEHQLLSQMADLEQQLKNVNGENALLRQQHQAQYTEMSRLTESKIALQKQNSSLQDEIAHLQTVLPKSPRPAVSYNNNSSSETAAPTSHNHNGSSSDYDWAQANSDIKHLASVEQALAQLRAENHSLAEENERLRQQKHSNEHKGPAMNGPDLGGSAHLPHSCGDGEMSNGQEVYYPNGEGASIKGETISLAAEVGEAVKATMLRLQLQQSNSNTALQDWVGLMSELETKTKSKMHLLTEKENSLSQEIASLKGQLNQVNTDKEDLTRRNERFQSALNDTEASVVKLDLALSTLEAEYKEKLRCLTEENDLLRHDTDKVVDLQMELDQVKVEKAKLQQNQGQGELENSVGRLTQHLSSQSESVDSLNQKLKLTSLEAENASLLLSNKSLQEDTVGCESSSNAAEKLSQMQQQLDTKQSLLEAAHQQVSELKLAMEALQAKEKQMEDASSAQECDKLQHEVAELNSRRLEALQDDNSLLKQSIERTANESNSEFVGNMKSLEESVAQMRQDLDSKTSQIESLQSTLTSQDVEMKQVKEEKASLEQSLQAEKSTLESVRNELNAQTERLKEQLSTLSDMSSLKSDLEVQSNLATDRLAQLEAKTKDVEEANRKLGDLEKQLEQGREELDCEKRTLQHQMEVLNGKLQEAETQLQLEKESSGSSADSLRAEVDEKNKRLEDLNNEVNELKQQLSEKSEQLSACKHSETDLSLKLEEQRRACEALESELKHQRSSQGSEVESLQSRCSELQSSVSTLEEEKRRLTSDLDRLRGEVDEKNRQIEDLDRVVAEKEQQLSEERSRLEDALKRSEESVREKTEAVSLMEQSLKQEQEASEKKANELQQRLNELQDTHSNEKRTLEAELSQLRSEMEGLRKQLETSEASLTESRAQLESVKRDMSEQVQNNNINQDKSDTQSVTSCSSSKDKDKDSKDKEKKKGLGSFLKKKDKDKDKNKDEN